MGDFGCWFLLAFLILSIVTPYTDRAGEALYRWVLRKFNREGREWKVTVWDYWNEGHGTTHDFFVRAHTRDAALAEACKASRKGGRASDA